MVWTHSLSSHLGNSGTGLAGGSACSVQEVNQILLIWLISIFELVSYDKHPDWDTPDEVWDAVLGSVIMDYILGISEVVHRIKLHKER